jgi:hypothetical protein
MSFHPHTNDASDTQAYRTEWPVGGHKVRHGRPSSWALVAVVIAAFIAGGFAIVFRLWPLFWVCVGIFVLSVPAGKVLGIMDDTMTVEGPVDETKPAQDRGTVSHPGVRVR